MKHQEIIEQLPYSEPFLFVDELIQLSAERSEGCYTFPESAPFYKGHFKAHPVTPGVLLTECCAQIGLVCLGLYLLKDKDTNGLTLGLSSANMEFFIPVYPGEKVRVVSEKIYFRFHKLKCLVQLFNTKNQLVCKGVMAGMIGKTTNE